MSEVAQAMFSCNGCKRKYRWKSELAGKKVKCKCGNVMVAPAQSPAADDLMDAMYDLAAAEAKAAKAPAAVAAGANCPGCSAELAPGAVLCINCGFNLKTGARISTVAETAAAAPAKAPKAKGGAKVVAKPAVGGVVAATASSKKGPASPFAGYTPKRVVTQDEDNQSMVTEIWAPIVLLAAGLVLSVMQKMYFDKMIVPLGTAILIVTIRLIIDMILLAIGCLAAMKLIDLGFGHPGTAVLKIAAIAMAPGAAAEIISYLLKDPFGLVGATIALVLYVALFFYFFDMDFSEIRIIGAIVWVTRTWAGYALAALVISQIMPSMSGLGGAGLGQAEINSDLQVADYMEKGWLIDANEYLAAGGSHTIGSAPNEMAQQVVKDIYSQGAKKVWIMKNGGEIYIEMPSEKPKRKKIMGVIKALQDKLAFDRRQAMRDKGMQVDEPVKDESNDNMNSPDKGQKYLITSF